MGKPDRLRSGAAVRPDGPIGVVLAAPVLQDGMPPPRSASSTFSYDLAPLMLTNDDLSLFSVVLKDPRERDVELVADDRGAVAERPRQPGRPRPRRWFGR